MGSIGMAGRIRTTTISAKARLMMIVRLRMGRCIVA
jgi:hypothetical protein